VKNIIFRHLHALRSLDLGTNESNWMHNWHLTNISMPLTFLRLVLDNPQDLIRLMLTRPLSLSLKHLHIMLRDIMSEYNFRLPSKDQLFPMKQLYTFTLVKSFRWKLKNELSFLDILTSAEMMPMLRRINFSINLNDDELSRIKQCSIFQDHRCVDVHFVLCIENNDGHIQLKKLIPHGSVSYPREVMGSVFTVNYWYDVGYSSTVQLARVKSFEVQNQNSFHCFSFSVLDIILIDVCCGILFHGLSKSSFN
jgi:hypothetical protein